MQRFERIYDAACRRPLLLRAGEMATVAGSAATSTGRSHRRPTRRRDHRGDRRIRAEGRDRPRAGQPVRGAGRRLHRRRDHRRVRRPRHAALELALAGPLGAEGRQGDRGRSPLSAADGDDVRPEPVKARAEAWAEDVLRRAAPVPEGGEEAGGAARPALHVLPRPDLARCALLRAEREGGLEHCGEMHRRRRARRESATGSRRARSARGRSSRSRRWPSPTMRRSRARARPQPRSARSGTPSRRRRSP